MAMSGSGMGGYAGAAQAAGDAWQQRLGGFGSLLNGLFNDPRQAYGDAQRSYDPWMQKATDAYNPFYQAGTEGIGKYQDWLGGMQDPSGFINNLMGGYQESPYAKYLQDYANKAGINAASASGLTGSTPWMQQSQQNAAGIASGDMQNWLSQVLGINSQYGQGWGNIMGQGFNAASGMANIFGQRAQDEAQLAYGKEAAGQSRTGNIVGGLLSMFGG